LASIKSNQISEIQAEKIGNIKTTSVQWVWWYIIPASTNWSEDDIKSFGLNTQITEVSKENWIRAGLCWKQKFL